MRTVKTLIAFALVAMLAAPALAGPGHKCTASTDECLKKMVAKLKHRGWVGIEMDEVEGTKYYEITRVVPGSPAETAGLQVGDVLTGVNGVDFGDKDKEKMKKAKHSWSPGDTVKYMVKRNGQATKIAVTLGELPKDVLAQWVGKHMLEHAAPAVAKK
jgi:S1-C subfamily serine protease